MKMVIPISRIEEDIFLSEVAPRKLIRDLPVSIFLLAVALTALYVFAPNYWRWIRRRTKYRNEYSNKENKKFNLRNQPLIDGESINDRIYTRFMQGCSGHFHEIAKLRMKSPSGEEWRRLLEKHVYLAVRPTLTNEQYDILDETLATNRKQSLISRFERPILKASEELEAVELRKKALRQKLNVDPSGSRLATMDGLGFERLCRENLAGMGWQAKITKASGDQGADIIATRGGTTVAVQCKFYSGSIGNSAVQQVIAARVFYSTTHAVVIAKDDTYTPAARELAMRSNVVLMTISNIAAMNRL